MRDSVISTVPIAKLVRRISISYVGTLLYNGKIFDNNTGASKGSKGKSGNVGHLTFRTVTGNFIKGLERGMEIIMGGGEGRVVAIPPELGYSMEGSK